MTAPLLELEHVDAGYGPFRALFDVSFSVDEGRALALLGSNGAGKTTVARVCSGLVAPTAGTVRFRGDEVTGQPAFRLARQGVAHAPEGRSVFATLTVDENLVLSFREGAKQGHPGVDESLAAAYDAFPRLATRRQQLAGTLSGGEQRMLSLARVLVQPPALLIVDELSLGLAPIIVNEVYAMLGRIKAAGTTLLIVEQLVSHALGIADDVVLLTKGRTTFVGPVAELGDLDAHFLG
ncbi:MAG: ABC transporter ATP-binding protein [Acidimicrobiales bacterium]|nr:ABC transporter ATP-binding protein [Acidimicrobiales bacterium]